MHEASLYENNCFITLTYADKHIPANKSLILDHFQKFMKRLRIFASRDRKFKKACRKKFGKDFLKIRFFHCGEYGTICKTCGKSKIKCECPPGAFIPALGRPHYHACLFNFDFPDLELAPIYQRPGAPPLFVSKSLQKIWKKGFSTIGRVNFESAAYVARYITKKITGSPADEHYEIPVEKAGFKWKEQRKPEYTTMSRGGRTGKGIAHGWYTQFKSDVFPSDEVVLRGKQMKPPKYYDRCLEFDNVVEFTTIKAKRKAKALQNLADNTTARLAIKEICKTQQHQQLKRGMENE